MKKLIFGISLMLIGFIGNTILCAGAMSSQFTVNGSNNIWKILELFGVMPYVIILLIIGIAGLAFAIAGLLDKKE